LNNVMDKTGDNHGQAAIRAGENARAGRGRHASYGWR
jgi:hypothetical protein